MPPYNATARKKSERRWHVRDLLVQEADVSFERRRELFQNKTALLDFAQQTLPLINPALWLRFTDFCKAKQVDLSETIRDAVGNQADYEQSRMESHEEDNEYLLDEYLSLRIEDWLSQKQEKAINRETHDSLNNEPDVIIVIEGDKHEEWFEYKIPI